ncbi:prephenate dehydrogenase [Rhodococcus sp. NPDC058521]|uniref:prephenate dehydrogenase n=1 Tax=Rhodococcus sp. NPDC058521 TaxID=3346536 RepID=UPI0036565CF3
MCQPVRVSDTSSSTPVCVLGLGLIGGSLLRAATAAGRSTWGYNRSNASVEAARADGFEADTDLVATAKRAADENALIVIAVPVPAVDTILGAIAEHAPDCPITDVVSVKAEIAAAVGRHGLAKRYVGGHPMAGTSESGWAAGDENLFRGAVWVVATDEGADAAVWTEVARLALDCGAEVVPADSKEHDRAAARISHLPHILAETLAITGDAGGPLALGLAAGSFRDGTRVAGSAPRLVRAMCEGNQEALLTALDEALELLTKARTELADRSSTEDLVDSGHAARLRYEQRDDWEISGIAPGDDGWVMAMREAGRRGGRLRSL